MKKIISVMLTVALVVSLLVGFANPSEWAVPEVDEARANNLIVAEADQNFQMPISRALFCKLIVQMVEQSYGSKITVITQNPFVDTNDESIIKAFQSGIVKGVSATQFAPNNLITRQEVAIMMMRAFRLLDDIKGTTLTDNVDVSGLTFADEASIADWAIDDVRQAVKLGIIKGVGDNKIDPLGNTTVEQSILLSLRLYKRYLPQGAAALPAESTTVPASSTLPAESTTVPASSTNPVAAGDAAQPAGGDAAQPAGGDAVQPAGGDAVQPAGGDAVQPAGGDAVQPAGGDAADPGAPLDPEPSTDPESSDNGNQGANQNETTAPKAFAAAKYDGTMKINIRHISKNALIKPFKLYASDIAKSPNGSNLVIVSIEPDGNVRSSKIPQLTLNSLDLEFEKSDDGGVTVVSKDAANIGRTQSYIVKVAKKSNYRIVGRSGVITSDFIEIPVSFSVLDSDVKMHQIFEPAILYANMEQAVEKSISSYVAGSDVTIKSITPETVLNFGHLNRVKTGSKYNKLSFRPDRLTNANYVLFGKRDYRLFDVLVSSGDEELTLPLYVHCGDEPCHIGDENNSPFDNGSSFNPGRTFEPVKPLIPEVPVGPIPPVGPDVPDVPDGPGGSIFNNDAVKPGQTFKPNKPIDQPGSGKEIQQIEPGAGLLP